MEAERLLLLNWALKKTPMPKPPWIASTKKGLRASKQLSHVACARNKEGKAGRTGRKGVVGEVVALLAGRVICGYLRCVIHSPELTFPLQVGVIAPLLVKQKERVLLCIIPLLSAAGPDTHTNISFWGWDQKINAAASTATYLYSHGCSCSWVKHLSVVLSKSPCFQEALYM